MHHANFAACLLAALLHAPAMAEPPVALIARRHCLYLATGYTWDRAIASAIRDATQAGATVGDIAPGDVVGAIQVWCPVLNRAAFLSRQGVQ